VRLSILRCALLLLSLAPLGWADVVVVPISVDTSSLSGTTGSFDLQFNPGPLVSQSASLTINNFMSSGGSFFGAPFLTGDVSGTLPSALIFDNGSPFNDYFQDFTFGSSLSFTVALSGPAVFSPDGTSTSGSEFGFSMFSDPAGTAPALTNDTVNGFAVIVSIGTDGSVTAVNLSSETTMGSPTDVPEPGSFAFVLVTAAILAVMAYVHPRSRTITFKSE